MDNLPTAKVVKLPDLQEKEDIYDWLKAGHTMEEITELPLLDKIEYSNSSEKYEQQQEGKPEKTSNHETQSEILLRLVEENEAVVFHDSSNDCYISLAINGHRELYEIRSENCRLWLSKLFYDHTRKPIKKEYLIQAIDVLFAKAFFDSGESISLYERVAKKGNDFWYDLTNNDWQAVKITAEGWRIENNPPLLFRRYRHQKPQTCPSVNGDILKLLKFINIKKRKTLFLCWVVSCFIPDIPHAMPVIHGEKGAAKTTACVLLKKLIDPSSLETLTLTNSSDALRVNLQQHWFLPFDNVSHIGEETSDTLCRAITGGGIQVRRLYTDSEDCIFTFRKCLAINGINNVAGRPDLLDRAILIELSRISEDERQELSIILNEFEKDLPQILGGIFDILSKAMAIYPTVKLDKLPRMADFAKWCYAIAEAMGYGGQVFIDEYACNQEYQNMELLNSNTVAILVIEFMKDLPEWSGQMSELYDALATLAEKIGISKKSKGFPSQPNVLSRWLNGLRSNLSAIGITYEHEAKYKGSYIRIKNDKSSPLPPYSPVIQQSSVLSEYNHTSVDILYGDEADDNEDDVIF